MKSCLAWAACCWRTSRTGSRRSRPGTSSKARRDANGGAAESMVLVDSHCHLDAAEFDGDRDAVISRARDAGVHQQMVPAVDAASWPKLREVCVRAAGLFPAYVLHPMYLDAHRGEHLSQLREWIERERPLAVGECGL